MTVGKDFLGSRLSAESARARESLRTLDEPSVSLVACSDRIEPLARGPGALENAGDPVREVRALGGTEASLRLVADSNIFTLSRKCLEVFFSCSGKYASF